MLRDVVAMMQATALWKRNNFPSSGDSIGR